MSKWWNAAIPRPSFLFILPVALTRVEGLATLQLVYLLCNHGKTAPQTRVPGAWTAAEAVEEGWTNGP